MQTLGYLVIANCVVEHTNAEANQYVVGLPALTSFTGFAHQQIRLLSKHTQLNLYENGTAIIVHDFQLRDGHPRCPAYLKEEDGSKAASIVEEMKADLRVSVLVRIAIDNDDDKEELRDEVLNCCFTEQRVREKLRYLAKPALQQQPYFLSGGHCKQLDTLRFMRTSNDVSDWLKSECKAGFVIQDRYDLLASDGADGITPLDSIVNSMTVSKVDEHRYERQRKGWLLPVAVGYQAIEKPQHRSQARFGHPHVYAEPVTGLAEMVSVKRITDLTQHAIFWTHHYQADNGLYYVTALGA